MCAFDAIKKPLCIYCSAKQGADEENDDDEEERKKQYFLALQQ